MHRQSFCVGICRESTASQKNRANSPLNMILAEERKEMNELLKEAVLQLQAGRDLTAEGCSEVIGCIMDGQCEFVDIAVLN